MTQILERDVSDARRIRQFASFFKNYMGASTIVVAALPVPVAHLQMIPTHAPDRGSISVMSSLLCFLLLAYIFYNRHKMARLLFQPDLSTARSRSARPRERDQERGRGSRRMLNLSILVLIVTSVGCFFYYQLTWIAHGHKLALIADARVADARSSLHFGFDEPIVRLQLMVSYVVFFGLAETAFVLMATKEYLQELLGLSDEDLIFGDPAKSAPDEATPTAE